MFLNRLSNEEKKAFIGLSVYAAMCNGDFHDKEKDMIEEYCKEMGIAFFDAENITSLSEIINLYSKSETATKRIVLMELLGLMYTDGNFDDKEKEFVKKIAQGIGLNQHDIDVQQKVLQKYMAVIEEMTKAIFQ